ncbi:MAG: hypothetical protein M0Q49_01920 [Porticoccaceae bacterium]|nr:hypothetical protein [Porticoccaceae bacterium]
MNRKRLYILSALILCLGVGVVLANGFAVAVLSQPGQRTLPPAVDAAQVVALEVLGGDPADGTVTVSRVTHNRAATNAVATLTLSGGVASEVITNGLWLIRGDTLLWGGSATGGTVRVYLKR